MPWYASNDSHFQVVFFFRFDCVRNTTMEQLVRCMFRVEGEIKSSRCAHNICENRWCKNGRDIVSIAKSSFDNIQRSNGCVDRETFDNVSSSSNHLVTVQTNHFQKK